MRLALCVFIAVLALSCSAYATTTAYSDQASFLGAIAPGYYLENFSTFSDGDPLGGDPSPTDYSSPVVNGYSFHVYGSQGLWSLPNMMSGAYPFDPLVITFSGAPVTAVGATFAGTDFMGQPIEGASVIVSLADGTSQTIDSIGFAGFTSSAPISSITVTPGELESEANWAAFTNLYIGAASGTASVPEPSSVLSILTGLVGMGSFLVRRRRG